MSSYLYQPWSLSLQCGGWVGRWTKSKRTLSEREGSRGKYGLHRKLLKFLTGMFTYTRQAKVYPSGFDVSSQAELGAANSVAIGTEYEQPSYGRENPPVAYGYPPPDYSRTQPPDVDSISTYEQAFAAPSLSAPHSVRQQRTIF